VVFPQTEIGSDPGVVREYAQAVEEMGYSHILVYDHVLGASTKTRPGWRGPYNSETQFHEPFVLFGYLAGLTRRIELVTGVIILPQRQTALVAKQAAEVDALSGGRLRLGVGIGWNTVEYEGLNENFSNRGVRLEEQIEVLRALWSGSEITYQGRWHTIDHAGINPLPVQRPIPVWVGGRSAAAYRRAGRLADGWLPQVQPGPELERARALIDESAVEAGRDPAAIGCEGRIAWRGDLDAAVAEAAAWRTAGATHLGVNTMGANLSTVDDHLTALGRVAEALRPGQPAS